MTIGRRWLVAGALLGAAVMTGVPAFALGSGPGAARGNAAGTGSGGVNGAGSGAGANGSGDGSVQSARLAAVKAAATLAITKREDALTAAEAVIRATAFLGADQQILLGQLQSAASGLTGLGATIQADTTPAAAAADSAHIFNQYRVFALVIPVAHLVRAGDAALNVVIPDLGKVATLAQGRISPADQPLLTDLTAQVAKASAELTGLSAQLEADTPAEWNASHQLFATDRAALRSARQALAEARQDAHAIAADLSPATSSVPTTSTPVASTTTG